MEQPLLEPCLLISDNCRACRGTAELPNGAPCEDCNGSGREVREMPLSAAWELAQGAHARLVAPPPSALREAAREDE